MESMNYPDGYVFSRYLSPTTILVTKDSGTRFAVYKKVSPEIIARMIAIEPLGYTPKVYWNDGQYILIEWIEGSSWKIYTNNIILTKELAEWYILENWRIHRLTGGHGDFVWYNVMITSENNVKWIDIGAGGLDDVDFINQMWMHTYRMFTKEHICSLIYIINHDSLHHLNF